MSFLKQIQEAEQAKRTALQSLHGELGYESPQAFMRDYVVAMGARVRVSDLGSVGLEVNIEQPTKRKRGARRTISDQTRRDIRAALLAGEPASTLGAKFGVSTGTVYRIKESVRG